MLFAKTHVLGLVSLAGLAHGLRLYRGARAHDLSPNALAIKALLISTIMATSSFGLFTSLVATGLGTHSVNYDII
jgi:hypothetical protein